VISDVERFLKEFKVENKSKWESFKKVINRRNGKSKKY